MGHVGQLDLVATGETRVGVKKVSDLGEHGITLVRRQDNHVAARCDQVDNRVAREAKPPRHVATFERPERRPDNGVRIVALVIAMTVHDAAELGDPIVALVADVPEQAEPATRGQDSRNLGHRPRRVDPMPGLGDEDGVDRAVVQGDLLGGAGEQPSLRYAGRKLLAHAGGRFNGDDVEAAVTELTGELPRSCAEVENAVRADRDQPFDRLGRVRRASPLVRGRGGAE